MKILIIGAGLSGCVIAEQLSKEDKIEEIHIIDRRDHIGGNCYDYEKNKINIHKYGPHIFHTDNKEVYEYLLQFTEFIDYKHKVKALLENGEYVTLPANKNTKSKLDHLGLDIIETLFRPYSEKMWGIKLEELNPSIINRVPIRDDDNELYFPNDKYQGLPKDGYYKMFNNMIKSNKIKVFLSTEYKNNIDEYNYVFNSMSIDEYFDFKFGELPYRSLKFHTFSLKNIELPTPTVNYTDNSSYTRITDWKMYPCELNNHSRVSYITLEEPTECKDVKERYYPVVNDKSISLYNKYKNIIPENMRFIGRCGNFKYIDMDDAVKLSLDEVKRFKSTFLIPQSSFLN